MIPAVELWHIVESVWLCNYTHTVEICFSLILKGVFLLISVEKATFSLFQFNYFKIIKYVNWGCRRPGGKTLFRFVSTAHYSRTRR